MTDDRSSTDERIRAYLDRVTQRLAGEGYRIPTTGVSPYLLSAEKSGFVLTKLGNVDTSIRVGLIREPTRATLAAFSAAVFEAARTQPHGFRLPNGFFNALAAHAVAIVDHVNEDLACWVATNDPRKRWGSFESLSVFDLSTGQLE